MKWVIDLFADAVDEAALSVSGLSGHELNAPIYSFVFLILFTAKVFGVLAWPWWAVFVPLVAAPLVTPLWWVALLPSLILMHVVGHLTSRLLRWSVDWRAKR